MRLRLALVLSACLLLAGCAGRDVLSFGSAPMDAESHIVVALHDPGVEPRRRAGSTPRAYGWPGRYRGSPQARQRAARLAGLYGLRAVDDWPIELLDVYCIVFAVPPGSSRDALLAQIAAEPGVALAQPLQEFSLLHERPSAEPPPAPDVVGLSRAHRWATGRGVRVAVVDTGLDRAHPGLEGRVRRAADFVGRRPFAFAEERHGLAVAGVIAARADPEVGAVGVAPRSELLVLRACWHEDVQSAVCNSFTLARALSAAVTERAAVINLSLTGPPDPLLEQLLREAMRRGVFVVGAASGADEPQFPASVAGVLPVRAAEHAGDAAPGHLLAPGEGILTLGPGGGYVLGAGSSLAAAHVSGVVALLLERKPGISAQEVRALLARHAQPAALRSGRVVQVVDACETVAALSGERCEAAAAVRRARGDTPEPSEEPM